MNFTIDNVVSTYYSALGHQSNYWNIYIAVSFGLLAYFGTNKVDSDTTSLIIIGFVIFALSNLYNIWSAQKNLVKISDGLSLYTKRNSSKIPPEFKAFLPNVKAITVWYVCIYHIASIIFISYVMFELGKK